MNRAGDIFFRPCLQLADYRMAPLSPTREEDGARGRSVTDIVAADGDKQDLFVGEQFENYSVRIADGESVVLLEIPF